MKFFNKKVTIGGIKFDSKKEGERWLVLLDMQKKGVISDLQRQVEWEIIPKLTYMKTVQLKTKTKQVERVDELPAHYTCDFVYRREGKIVVEEVKSKATAKVRDYPLRKKLIKWKLRRLSKQEGVEYVFNEIK